MAKLRALHNRGVATSTTVGDTQEPAVPEIGTMMKDGTIYVGESPTTHKPMYAAPADAPLTKTFGEAAEYAKTLEVGDKKDFRVPDIEELKVLFENREKGALKGTFNLTGSYPSGWYWSGTPYVDGTAYGQRFSDGIQYNFYRFSNSSVRCVR
jgi:hypothetical protein